MANAGYNNRDKRVVKVTRAEKKTVSRLRRRALKREVQGVHLRRSAERATRWGWWHA